MKKLLQMLCLVAAMFYGGIVLADAIDINTADAQTLADTIVGVGQKRAEAIVAYREEHGPFKSVDELTQVKGIGLKLVENNRDKLMVGEKKSP